MTALFSRRARFPGNIPGTLALDRVTFGLRRGKVTALIGENGAGKSTLVKLLGGIEQPTAGLLLLDGTEIRIASVRDADALGIAIIHQELNLCPNLTVAENIFLGREMTSRGLLDARGQRERAREILAHLEQPIDPAAVVADLPLGRQQIVEIAKALARDVRVLMMDEPTSALSAAEIHVLFRIIRELAARGVAIVYISHRLEELLEISDFVTVLRDGRTVGEAAAREIDARWIVERMTGRRAAGPEPAVECAAGREVLRAKSLSLRAENGRPVLRDVSFTVGKGEILGIYGLMGAGRTDLLECLMGLRPELQGSVFLDTSRIDRLDTASRIAAGLVMVPEDRQRSGLVQSLSVCANLTLSSLGRFVRRIWLSRRREESAAAGMAAGLQIRLPGLRHDIGALSGGNQQKVVIGKCLLTDPRVLLLDEPTRGVDVGAKSEIHAIVRRLAEQGLAIVLVSSELEEIRAAAHRILVMSRGAVTAEFMAGEATGDALAAAACAGETAW